MLIFGRAPSLYLCHQVSQSKNLRDRFLAIVTSHISTNLGCSHDERVDDPRNRIFSWDAACHRSRSCSCGVYHRQPGEVDSARGMDWISHKLSPTHPDLVSSRAEEHSHLHFHGGKIHVHPHSHQGSTQHHAKEVDPPHWLADPFVKLGWFHSLRPLLVGIVHGLAGSAAVALLVLGTIHDARWAIFYLLLFGIGTITGMMLITLAFAVPVTFAGNRFAWVSRTMVTGTGVLSLVFGLVVAYQIGIADGLFSPHPSWTPH